MLLCAPIRTHLIFVFWKLDAPFASQSWHIVTLFYGLPVMVVIVAISAMTACLCYQVYSVQKASLRYGARKSMELSRRVFWQSAFYVAAFYVTLPFVLLSYYVKFAEGGTEFWIFAVASVMAPAQGLMNALIHFQRKGASADALSAVLARRVSSAGRAIRRASFSRPFSDNSAESPYPTEHSCRDPSSNSFQKRRLSRNSNSSFVEVEDGRSSLFKDPSEATEDRIVSLDEAFAEDDDATETNGNAAKVQGQGMDDTSPTTPNKNNGLHRCARVLEIKPHNGRDVGASCCSE